MLCSFDLQKVFNVEYLPDIVRVAEEILRINVARLSPAESPHTITIDCMMQLLLVA